MTAPRSAWAADLFAGKVAVVTGGTSGIGLGVAEALAALGASVRVVGFGASGVAASPGLDLTAQELDVTDAAGVAAFVDGLDRLDVLVNCAGVIRRAAEHDPEVFEQVIAINLTGTMRFCALARPRLAASKGSIVNMASMLSFFGAGLAPAYSASKGGVMQLTKSLAIAYAPEGIRVNAVAPGWIATPLTQALQDDTARAGAILSRTPLGRWGAPADVAEGVVFLASPAAAFVTGVILPVDGGYLTA
ncbi:NAD(P)-dependent dehydrogenase (short-subunit alcohol dehydrogenase family) [Methylopila capsulata]|uniref:NAD(P)-dependent dehydrogenase (Short-subunit alcohol dehydrogenase family) n=1 Tax=Methylopila capsulata TaxID=61654 RepID=A0A9W6IS09_9HYPH|nr:SDR family oxidoreductase [Methylopila capsulata]MBM7851504.1 NAD(P)-dependent dehydrogenase (short-subunit alcohol dehydrogenase family) [Methylopila capsulata]GLK54562.1 short-chain dehydrogenase [Methylopila capsulata]